MNPRSAMLENEKISKLLIKLSLPAITAMMVNALFNIVDTIFIGHSVGALGIAGVSLFFPIQMIVMAFSQMIGIGSASYMSRSMGAKDFDRVNLIAGNSFFYVAALGLVFAITGIAFTEPLLRIFGTTETIMPYAAEYARIMFIGVIFFPFCMSTNSLVRAEGNAKDAMYSMIIGFVVNIVLDYIFIFPFNMGIAGAAWASVLAKFSSFIYLVFYLHSNRTIIKVKLVNLKPRINIMTKTFSVGLSAYAMGAAGSIVTTILNHSLGYYGGDLAIAVYGVVFKVIMFLGMLIAGMMQGLQPVVGYNYGALKYERVKEALRFTIIAAVVLTGTMALIIQLFPTHIISIFTPDKNLIFNGTHALRIVILMTPVIGIQMAGNTLFQSLGKALPAFVYSILRQVLLFLPLMLLLPHFFNPAINGIWVAFPVADLLSVLITIPVLKRELDQLSLTDLQQRPVLEI